VVAEGLMQDLVIRNLRVDFHVGRETVHALRGVDLDVPAGSRTAIVGESGSGKTITGVSILRLLPANAPIRAGEIRFGGTDLVQLDERAMRGIRGGHICMVFQNALASLNPLYTVGKQIADVCRQRTGVSAREAWDRAVAVLAAAGIPDAPNRARNYPHEYSGGMAQRAMIAMALVCRPALIIADEPTSGLDVTIQAQVLDLIRSVVDELGASLLFITHDIGLIPSTCDRMVVMYAGSVMESGTADEVLARPANPYTRLLLACFQEGDGGEMPFIPGRVPDLREEWPGCGFAGRCPRAEAVCTAVPPPVVEVSPGHLSACHFAQ
jgi:oligopeptide/dipeptide ABC transporter ATP-binding protein